MELKEKLKAKIDRLFEKGFNVEFLEASEYEKEPIKIDRIKISQHSISNSVKNVFDDWEWQTRWERCIVVDFEPYPILFGDDAEEVYQHLIKENSNLLEKYLNE